ncbi:hypothetical protein [Mangrovimonas cancribranchiae]|uniref:Uncharacterized protein n=1 Tax=Mangrovimonas cancribranchiae TaxID=3080055 RepID=A0AAU6P064_9FLAO
MAQVTDSNSQSTSIPAVETEEEQNKSSVLDIQPLSQDNNNQNNKLNGMTLPESRQLNTQNQKEFSMFGEDFGNPGELYQNKVKKHNKTFQEEGERRNNGNTTNQYLGDYRVKVGKVNVIYRDFADPDGDRVKILVNDKEVKMAVLRRNFDGFKLTLEEGFNKIDFQALNQGRYGPNTAELQILDEHGNIIAASQWNLATGVKATLILVKE